MKSFISSSSKISKKRPEPAGQGAAAMQEAPAHTEAKTLRKWHDAIPAQVLRMQGERILRPIPPYNLLPSRPYCRPRSFTGACPSARELYRRQGIASRTEDLIHFATPYAFGRRWSSSCAPGISADRTVGGFGEGRSVEERGPDL